MPSPITRRRQRLALRGRARRERRLLADDGVLEHLHALAEHRARVDDRGRVDVGYRCAIAERVACSISSARTTSGPVARPSAKSPAPCSTSSRKCVHSSRSGSSVEIFGLKMSPVRVCHSPYVSGALPRRLLVDRHLALQLHVVEHDHLLAADDRDLPHLVRVEPREVHVRDLPAREAQVAERRRPRRPGVRKSRSRARPPRPAPRRAGRGSPTGRGRRATRARSRSCG